MDIERDNGSTNTKLITVMQISRNGSNKTKGNGDGNDGNKAKGSGSYK